MTPPEMTLAEQFRAMAYANPKNLAAYDDIIYACKDAASVGGIQLRLASIPGVVQDMLKENGFKIEMGLDSDPFKYTISW